MIKTQNNFLTDEECNSFIKGINNKTNKICFTDNGKFENDKYTNPELADYFYQKLKPKLEFKTYRANNLIMTGKYTPNEEFGIHTDTGLYYNIDQKEKSRYTLLIYLNDDFEGGETIFYDDYFKEIKRIIPKKGMALIFDIDLWHKANKVKTGYKYWIGCEIIASM